MPDSFRDIRLCLKQVLGILTSLTPDIDAAMRQETDPELRSMLGQARAGVTQATRVIAERIALWDPARTTGGHGKEWVEL